MKKNSPYIKCPRCELNYIPKGEDLCDVCKAELKLIQGNPLIPDDEEEILCPVCKQNYISIDEDMCFKCAERIGERDTASVHEDEEEWRTYLDDDKEAIPEEDLEVVSLSDLEEEEKGKGHDEDEEFIDGKGAFDDEEFDDEDLDGEEFGDEDEDEDEDDEDDED